MQCAAIVLAAGAGTRMNSKKPKVAHEILGKPLVRWVVDAAHEAGITQVISVLGHGREQVEPLVSDDTVVVIQPKRDGTAGALCACSAQLADFKGSLVVLSGDCPLISAETISNLIAVREQTKASVVVLTVELDTPFGYGRICRDAQGGVERIVEEKDATPQQAAITECNAGFYCFDASVLFEALRKVNSNNAQGELYLTDVIEICRRNGQLVTTLATKDADECSGINSRMQLAQATQRVQKRINAAHMAAGVSMMAPDQVWIGPDVIIERDVELLPQTFLLGSTQVAEDSVIGPHTRLVDTQVGRGCLVDETIAIGACLDAGSCAGPRAYLRPGTHLCEGAKAGTHVEIKKSTVGKHSKVPHLSYIGDTTIGEEVNIGAGSITCNYDGEHKWPTVIGDKTFVGSDTMMVAPVRIGAGAVIGAGSCITKDVSAGALALTRPEQREIEHWAAKRRARKSS